MSLAVLHIQQNSGPDDVITFDRWSADTYVVKYKPNDLKDTSYQFYMSLDECKSYLYRTLKLLSLDNHPFSHIQMTTRAGPSILFEIPDLGESDVRYLIEDALVAALRVNPKVLRE